MIVYFPATALYLYRFIINLCSNFSIGGLGIDQHSVTVSVFQSINESIWQRS